MKQIVLYLALTVGGILAGVAIAQVLGLHHAYRAPPAPVSTEQADVAPPGWTVSCERDPGAAWASCQTYPPGDNGWTSDPPVPPHRPAGSPSGSEAR